MNKFLVNKKFGLVKVAKIEKNGVMDKNEAELFLDMVLFGKFRLKI